MKKYAFLFPGQGSQSIGMGEDLYKEYDIVRELFDMAEEISKINLSKLCFKGPIEMLTQTINLQPAVTAVNLACLRAIEKEGLKPDITAGHSLGEYSALGAAGVTTALVLSGETRAEDIPASPHQPDYVVENLAELYSALTG